MLFKPFSVGFNVKQQEDVYHLSNFLFENLQIKSKKDKSIDTSIIEGCTIKNVNVE